MSSSRQPNDRNEQAAAQVRELQVFPETDLDYFLFEHRDLPDETVLVFAFAPYKPQPDGTFRPPSATLGRIREEQLLRVAFPHAASTVVW